ncbi:MAG TPA: tail fiber domain-containing protein [Bacteroidia bacterium]
MRINQNLTTPINTVNQNVSGYVGIAPSGYFAANTPAAMLHLYGPNNTTFGIGGGWRRWMQTGMLVNENSDAIYVGMMPQPGLNRSDAVVAWNDDGGGGQDKLRFIFTGANTNGSGTGTNPIDPRSLNGYEFMRMASSPSQTNSTGQLSGNIGIGPVFTDALPPQNRLHMNAEENLAVFMQVSNQNGTGQGPLDGLIAGYSGTTTNNQEAIINQRENDRLSLYTNNGERMRITHLGALNAGVGFNPGALPANRTRVAFSHDPSFPVTRPLSLLHLGYNTGAFPGGVNDGWRPWMDIGMFISNGTDNGYLGLKHETNGLSGDREDMVLNWGDNQSAGPLTTGPDNLRFIFTSTTTGVTGTAPATGPNGLEGMRMTPTLTTGIFTGIGGDPTPGATGNQYGPAGTSINPTATLEVNAWGATNVAGGSSGLRFTNLNTISPVISPNPGPGVLSVDADGDVIYVAGGGSGPGNYCGVVPSNPLTADYEIPMNTNNYYFTDPAGSLNDGENFVKIGDNCGAAITAKLEVHRGITTNSQSQVSAAYALNDDIALSSTGTGFGFGVTGNATGQNRQNAGVHGLSSGSETNFGGLFRADAFYNSSTSQNANNYGVEGYATEGQLNYGVSGKANGNGIRNYGGVFDARNASNRNVGIEASSNGGPSNNIGGRFIVGSGLNNNVGIYAQVPNTGSLEYAGYFQGDVFISGPTCGTGYAVTSDQMFKTDVDVIKSGLETLRKLRPHTYKMDVANYPQFNFDSQKQYGFIAQEVEAVLPELVIASQSLEETDDAGNVIHPSVSFKALNYNALIPITIQAINEISSQIDRSTLSDQSIKTNVQNLSGSLAKVKQMRGVHYDWSTAAQNTMDLDSLQHIGFIAQEINAIEPLLTFVDDSSLMHVNYDRVVPILVESIKELDSQLQQKDSAISAMQAQINQILNNMESCCNTNHTMLQNNSSSVIGLDVELKDGQSIVLEQNVPNPFAEQTTISYFLPENTSKAQILFYNSQGKLIQSTELTQKGKGQLNVFASDLTNGIYTYSLVVDGKIIETRKMVKQ